MAVDKNTIGTTGDYATLELWEAGEAGDITAAGSDVIARAALLDEAHSDAFVLNNGSWVTDDTHYILIDADDDAEHAGTAGSGARIAGTSGGHVLSISVSGKHVHFERLEVTSAVPTAHQAAFFTSVTSARVVFNRCIIHDLTIANGRGIWINAGDYATEAVISNCLFYDMTFRAIHAPAVDTDVAIQFYNNTFDRTTIAIEIPNYTTGSRDFDLRNNIIEGGPALLNNHAGNTGWNAGCDQNILDDGSATTEDLPGDFIESVVFQAGVAVDPLNDQVMFESLTDGSEDYHVLAGPAGSNEALFYGNNLTAESMPTGVDITVDIAGVQRPASGSWDVGAFQLSRPTYSAPNQTQRLKTRILNTVIGDS